MNMSQPKLGVLSLARGATLEALVSGLELFCICWFSEIISFVNDEYVATETRRVKSHKGSHIRSLSPRTEAFLYLLVWKISFVNDEYVATETRRVKSHKGSHIISLSSRTVAFVLAEQCNYTVIPALSWNLR
ncbi:hypothetical protein BCS96_06890 [Vibrio breoganii]|nr:hypothetical protein BCT68_09290 [Vibrio breoganii]PMM88361.1 hypothetical protein BCT45_04035 [Vibrio breoganii]PMP00458.1 hypothetical protein BCS96_06890 [Vibrio breoganii]